VTGNDHDRSLEIVVEFSEESPQFGRFQLVIDVV
jgi:hypothetical protein